jgi:phenylpyruvate tautomerase PptA (4-oxalocrotonate tautomerase family)
MPLAHVYTNQSITQADAQARLLPALSRALATSFGKPERWVMTALTHCEAMSFAGAPGPAAYVEVKNIGTMGADKAKEVSAALCAILSAELGVPGGRIYVELTDAVGHLWGHDGDTFG